MLLAQRTRSEPKPARTLDVCSRLRQASRDHLRRMEAPAPVVQSTFVMRQVIP